ncbi:MAG: CRTAC1 family protein [Planctomycetaceae bacterium]|nr:CRTAC1 family protein [Planctomycetaceae bacterium]
MAMEVRNLIRIACMASLFGLNTGCRNDVESSKDPVTDASPNKAATKSLTSEDLRQAIEFKTRGLGHLENKEWAPAEEALTALAKLLPQDRAALRNLAVERVLALLDRESPFSQSSDPDAYAAAIAGAKEAITAMRAASPEDALLADHMLGRLLVHSDSPQQSTAAEGIDLLRKAAEASNLPEYWFALAAAMEGHRDFNDTAGPINALIKTHELQPDNMFVVHKLLERQALGLNSKDPMVQEAARKIPETIRSARSLVAPLNASIVKQRKTDLLEVIDKAMAGFDGTNHAALMGTAMITKNLMLPELATQIDRRRIDRNLLDYVLTDFESDTVQQLQAAGLLTVNSEIVIQSFTRGEGLPGVQAVSQIEFQDMNLDGVDDLIVCSQGKIQIYARDVETDKWTAIAEAAGELPFSGFKLADLDRDFDRMISDLKAPVLLRDRDGDRRTVTDPAGKHRWFDADLDVIAWHATTISLFRNNATDDNVRSLETITQINLPATINDVEVADIEADGDLDIIAATEAGLTVILNLERSGFEIVTESIAAPEYPISALAIGDWNRDVAMDLVGVSLDGAAGTLQNMLHSRFRWLTDTDGIEQVPAASEVRILDCDRNQSWDLLTCGPQGLTVTMTATSMTGRMSLLRKQIVTTDAVTSMAAEDIDNDGFPDIIALAAGKVRLFRGLADGSFSEITGLIADDLDARTIAVADADDDGDLDLIVATSDSLHLLSNEGGNTNGWLDIVARSEGNPEQFPSQRVNMHAIGGVMECIAGTHRQSLIIDKPRLHLGIGDAPKADAVRVIWTDGVPQNIVVPNLLKPHVGALHPQILKGSCPYIYTWNGTQFEFFSDCLWAAPIGLVQANGDLAPTRDWEYLLIPGEQLAERDQQYTLQLTEELWEAAYFDEVKLVAVDHPADVSIFTNEKVGSPQMAAHRIHTVQKRHLPASVTDGRGNDLLPALKSQDGNYTKAFEQRIVQGLTDQWTMEFDPGLPNRPHSLRLVLIGWVFPTDTSINAGLSQNRSLQGPMPPSLEVIDTEGQWKTARPFIGFPGGKTKAMVIDLSDVFLTDDFRFRITSSMELYWDTAFFIVDEQDAETIVQDCTFISADLHYRGFSARTYADNALFRNGYAPEGYDYQAVSTQPRWHAMMGRFTRYGDTTPLIHDADDQMVVMGPGDELTLNFAVPTGRVPEGWKRDFILYNVGWDKDADLNTVYGQSSEPYPSRSMNQYPETINIDEQTGSSDTFSEYMQQWQTREWSPRTLWKLR